MIINTETQIRIKKIECDTILKAANLQMGRPYIPYEGSYVFTPSLSQQTIEIEDMTAKHDIIIEPMPLGSATTPTTSAVANPSIGVDDNGLITASVSESFGVTPVVEEGYVINGTEGTVSVSGGSTKQLTTKAGTTITPTESVQTAVAKNVYTLGDVNVDAIPSTYIGSGITQRSSNDVTVNGATVTVPTGYYSNLVSKTVASGTEGTPIATKGAVTNHSVSVTPSVTNVGGYIEGGTHTGTAVSISASDLVSGTKSISSNGVGIDVTNYAEIDVDVEGSAPLNLESGSATIAAAGTLEHTPSTGYDGFDTFTTTTPTGVGRHARSTEYITGSGGYEFHIGNSYGVVSAGWFDEGEIPNSDLVFPAIPSGTSITPSESSQTIGGTSTMLQAAVTVNPIPSQYIVPSGELEITSNDEYDVTQYASVDVAVPEAKLQSGMATVSASGTVTHTPSTGYDGFDSFKVNVPAGAGLHSWTEGYKTESGNFIYFIDGQYDITTAGWFSERTIPFTELTFPAIPANTHVTPTTSAQTIGGNDHIMVNAITVDAMPSGSLDDYYEIGVENNIGITVSSTGLITAEVARTMDMYPVEQSGYIASTDNIPIYIDGQATQQLTTQGATTYSWSESDRTIASGTYLTGNQVIKGVPLQTINKITQNGTYQYDDGYYGFKGDIVVDVPSASPNLQTKTRSFTPDETNQTATVTADSGYDGLSSVSITVNGISADYVGTEIPRKTQLTTDSNYGVIAQAGYYENDTRLQIPTQQHYDPSITVSDAGLITATHEQPLGMLVLGNAQTSSTYQLTVGNNLEYGITDGTIPRAGIAKAGYAVL